MKQTYSNSSQNRNQSGESLIQALATIDALKSENSTLELMIGSQNKNSNENSREILIDVGRSLYLNSRSSRMRNLTSLLPSNVDENSAIFTFVDRIDSYFIDAINYINLNPKIRLFFIVWVILTILFAIKMLF